MEISIIITGYCILGCAVASCYKAIEQIIVKKPAPSNYALLLLLLCISYLQGSLGLFFTGITGAMPLQLFVTGLFFFITAAYLAGPLAYQYYNSLINPDADRVTFHLFPAFAASIVTLWRLSTRSSSYLLAMRENFFSANHDIPLYLLMAGAVLIIVVYTARILAIELSVRTSTAGRFAVRWLIIITAGLLLSPILLYAGFILKWIGLSAFGAVLLIVNNMLFILAQARYQDFFQALGKEVRLARYRKSVLKGLDIDVLHDRLNDLMNKEKYYRNFDISMKSTADELSITPHQLSCYLNKKRHVDFRKFINRYRVEEAKQLLVEKLDQNVLTIGFHVGFGSKTSFNVTFKEFTGKAPTEYRDEYLKGQR